MDESRISLARKADLRPSPLSTTLTHDLLTIHSSFHLNYLPEMIATFRGLLSGRGEEGMGLEEFEIEAEVVERVKFDGRLAQKDPRVVLTEAANRLAYQSNNLYFPQGSSLITKQSLDTFHAQTIARSQSHQPCSFILSVNDSKLIDRKELVDQIAACGIAVIKDNVVSDTGNQFNGGRELRIETQGQAVDFLLAFHIPSGGFIQSQSQAPLLIESLLKKLFPSAKASVTSDTSILTINFSFDPSQSAGEIKDALKRAVEQIRAVPDLVKDEELVWAQERARFNQALALDSRDTRLLLNSHHFALTGSLNTTTNILDLSQFRASLKACLQGAKPVFIGRGNYKKLTFYNEMF